MSVAGPEHYVWAAVLMLGYYPQLIALYKRIGMTLQPTDYTFSFSTLLQQRPETYLIHTGASGSRRPNLPSSWTVSDVIYLLYTGLSYVAILVLAFLSWHGVLPFIFGKGVTLTTLVDALPPLASFTQYALVPIFSAVGTMTTEDVMRAPLEVFLEYIHAGVGTSHYTLQGATAADVAKRLASPVVARGNLRLGVTVTGMSRTTPERGLPGDSLSIAVEQDGREEEIQVDQVVIATQASAARSLLKMLLPTLGGIEADKVTRMLDGLNQVEYRVSLRCFDFQAAG